MIKKQVCSISSFFIKQLNAKQLNAPIILVFGLDTAWVGSLINTVKKVVIVLLHKLAPESASALMVWPSNGIYLCQKPQAIYLKWLLFSLTVASLCTISVCTTVESV